MNSENLMRLFDTTGRALAPGNVSAALLLSGVIYHTALASIVLIDLLEHSPAARMLPAQVAKSASPSTLASLVLAPFGLLNGSLLSGNLADWLAEERATACPSVIANCRAHSKRHGPTLCPLMHGTEFHATREGERVRERERERERGKRGSLCFIGL